MVHGSLDWYGFFGLLAFIVSGTFGAFLLVADVVAVTYIFSAGPIARWSYWTFFFIVILLNVLLLTYGFWPFALGLPDPSIAGPHPALNVISVPAMVLFVFASLLRPWRQDVVAKRSGKRLGTKG